MAFIKLASWILNFRKSVGFGCMIKLILYLDIEVKYHWVFDWIFDFVRSVRNSLYLEFSNTLPEGGGGRT